MREYLFVYGTLHPDRAPAEIAHAVARLELVGAGSLRGQRLDLGDYPGVVLHTAQDELVRGTVFALPEEPAELAATLRDLDRYEDFRPDDVGGSLFLRVVHPVARPDGSVLDCWVYIYNR